MKKVTVGFLIICFLLFPVIAEGKSRVVLNPNEDIQYQLSSENTTYVIKNAIDLKGMTITIPNGSELVFKCKGTISNGIIKGNNTTLKGKVKLACELSGTFSNEEIPVTWLCIEERERLSQQIACIFNLNNICVLKLDKDIILDGSHKNVEYVAFSGNKTIRNCCSYKVKGDVMLHGVTFSDFETQRELFLNMKGITRPVTIDIKDVRFDGNWNISRFLYCPYQKIDKPSVLNITSSEFTRVQNFVIQFRSPCTGKINSNTIENIGTDKYSNVIGLHLGDSSTDADRHCANGFDITSNIFKNFKVPYNEKDDGREVHAMLIYGHENMVRENQVIDFHPSKDGLYDIGRDSEGIYLKGGNNTVQDNYLENCVGSGPDGAITIKSSYSNNKITGNTVRHQYGVGVQCYTQNSVIENNIIYSEEHAEAGMAMVFNSGSTIRNNEFHATRGKEYHAAIAMTSCEDIIITGNQFNNTSGILTTYKSGRQIIFKDNEVNLNGMIYGINTYYTAPIQLHDDTAEYVINNNTFTLTGVRTSQLIEARDGFEGKVMLQDNFIDLEDNKETQSAITYLARNVRVLTVERNEERSKIKKIGRVSNLK